MPRTPRNDRYPHDARRTRKLCGIGIDGIAATGGLPGGVSASEAMATAQAHHEAGRFREAEAIYRQVLDVSPSHPDALHLMGLLAYQPGRSVPPAPLLTKPIWQN